MHPHTGTQDRQGKEKEQLGSADDEYKWVGGVAKYCYFALKLTNSL